MSPKKATQKSAVAIQKVLIANRGEIAVRVAKTLQQMGIQVVAVYAATDEKAQHVQAADEAYPLAGESLKETYLNSAQLLDIAQTRGVDAIHPGYGFLSENADFARACETAGMTFIGPRAETIEKMGDKIVSKRLMNEAHVPTVPGWMGEADTPLETLQQEADRVGYPLLVKAAAGGGGKGMRLVEKSKDLPAALEAAGREAQKAFGDSRIFLERYLKKSRHIEFQIFGDTHGNVVHLFERECSIQRRHQKIVEETPSVALTSKLRAAMAEAACNAAKAVDYVGAGTVEFMLDEAGNFYFLEMNTRLQVEHPVTELVTHQDLVRAQILVAEGRPLPWTQEQLTQHGHAIECRVYAEDPDHQFLPSTGQLLRYQEPAGPNIRVDSGFAEGDTVTVHYDPMLAKLAVWGTTRSEAIARMQWALAHYRVLGVTTNLNFLQDVLAHPAFAQGDTDTHFLETHAIAGAPSASWETLLAAAAVAASASPQKATQSMERLSPNGMGTDPYSPWKTVSGGLRGSR